MSGFLSSDTKFESHCGWPAFYAAADGEKNIERHEDRSHGMVRFFIKLNLAYSPILVNFYKIRTEVTCKSCGAHLGHVFDDGPRDKTGERFCINGVALKFKKK